MVDKRTLEKYEREAKEKNRETWFVYIELEFKKKYISKGNSTLLQIDMYIRGLSVKFVDNLCNFVI